MGNTRMDRKVNFSSSAENCQVRKYSREGGMKKIKRERKSIGQIL